MHDGERSFFCSVSLPHSERDASQFSFAGPDTRNSESKALSPRRCQSLSTLCKAPGILQIPRSPVESPRKPYASLRSRQAQACGLPHQAGSRGEFGTWEVRGYKWGFPKIRRPFLGVLIIRTIVFWGLYYGPYFGKIPNLSIRPGWKGERNVGLLVYTL